jgi:predicted nucleic acid-binding Zn ribbon protein
MVKIEEILNKLCLTCGKKINSDTFFCDIECGQVYQANKDYFKKVWESEGWIPML